MNTNGRAIAHLIDVHQRTTFIYRPLLLRAMISVAYRMGPGSLEVLGLLKRAWTNQVGQSNPPPSEINNTDGTAHVKTPHYSLHQGIL